MADTPPTDIAIAQARAHAARADLVATLGILQERLTARALMRQAADAGQSAARKGADAARRHPAALAGAVAAAGLLLGRHRIAAAFRRRRRGETTPSVAS